MTHASRHEGQKVPVDNARGGRSSPSRFFACKSVCQPYRFDRPFGRTDPPDTPDGADTTAVTIRVNFGDIAIQVRLSSVRRAMFGIPKLGGLRSLRASGRLLRTAGGACLGNRSQGIVGCPIDRGWFWWSDMLRQ